MIHPEGRRLLIIVFFSLLALNLGLAWWLPAGWPWAAPVSLVLFLLLAQFFRYPRRRLRNHPGDPATVLAPADGKVLVVEEVEEKEYFKEKRIQVSIFMSLFNVHLNIAPVGGEVVFYKYHPGGYLPAWHPKSSTENEHTTVVVRHESGELLFRQVAGAVARRIRNYFLLGQPLQQGQEIGFIKMGSRVDVLLPLNAEVLVSLGDRVRFNDTLIARLPAADKT